MQRVQLDQPAPGTRYLRPGVFEFHQDVSKIAGRGHHIRVKRGEQGRPGVAQRGISRDGESPVLRMTQNDHRVALHKLGGAVGAAVIDDQDFRDGVALAQERFHGALDVALLVVHGEIDGDLLPARHRFQVQLEFRALALAQRPAQRREVVLTLGDA